MLVDHRITQESWAYEGRRRRRLAIEFGRYLSRLAAWSWFATFTFRRAVGLEEGLAEVATFLTSVGSAVSEQLGWFLAAEVGRLGDRVHCHALISGVHSLDRRSSQHSACRVLGRTRIETFNPKRHAAFYSTKMIAGQLSAFDLGGTLQGVDLSERESGLKIQVGRRVIVQSDCMPVGRFRK